MGCLLWQPLFALEAQSPSVLVSVKDLTPSGAPLKISGSADLHQDVLPGIFKWQWSMSLQVTNSSAKTVLAFEVSGVVAPCCGAGMAYTNEIDYFFEPQLVLGPGGAQSLVRGPMEWEEGPYTQGGPVRPPRAEFHVVFVEFADGSTWGASPWGASLESQRSETVSLLTRLLTEYRTGGEGSLRSAVSGDQQLTSLGPEATAKLMFIRDALKRGGPEAAVEQVTRYLAAAQEHAFPRRAVNPHGAPQR